MGFKNIGKEDLIEKHNACVENLDESKTCSTCKYVDLPNRAEPCASCYDTLLGFPVDPTKWEPLPDPPEDKP